MLLNINADTNSVIESPDTSQWYHVREDKKMIYYAYVVDQPAETEMQVAATYPNGGKDYKEVVVKEEVGHFKVTDENGDTFPYKIDIPEGISKENPVPDIVDMVYWKQYTPEEIAQREQESADAAEKAEARETFLNEAPDRVDNIESTQDDIVLFLADMVGGAS